MIPYPVLSPVHDDHVAFNTPLFASVSTGCVYYAAVRAQERYEGVRNAAWYFGALAVAGGAMGALAGLLPGIGAAALAGIVLGRKPWPCMHVREKRELMGQAIEIAVVEDVYKSSQVEDMLFLNARSIARPSSSYRLKGYFSQLAAIAWEPQSLADFRKNGAKPRIARAMEMLRACRHEARQWVYRHREEITRWRYDPRTDMRSDQL